MKRSRYSFFFVIFCSLWITFSSSWAAEPVKLVILPFNIHAEKDLSYLQKGVQDMLTTRLTNIGKSEPVKKEAVLEAVKGMSAIDEKKALALGQKFDAAYVVFGSLTFFGESVSTDARVLDVRQKQIEMTFSESGRDSGDVITHINQFASQVNQQVLGASKAVAAKPAAGAGQPVDESRQHPETLWTGRVDADRDGRPMAGSTDYLGSIWKSRHFKNEIEGLAVGDVDGDGQNETVLMDKKTVMIYRMQNDRFIKIADIEGTTNDRYLGIDVADINGNGKAEIFVTNLYENLNNLRSFVIEWDGVRFQTIVSDYPRYFRVLKAPNRAPVLAAQSRTKKRIFLPTIDELIWSDGKYVVAGPVLNVPSKGNVFNFNFGDVTNAGVDTIASFSTTHYLQLLAPDGAKEWESSDEYLPGASYLDFREKGVSSIGEYKETNRYFLPQRIIIKDVDSDGKNEVLVCKSKDSARGLFERLRLIKSGQIECLTWDQLGLRSKWRTREISGRLSDFQVADFDNNGQEELVFSVVKQNESVMGEARSYVISQEIKQ